MPGYLAGGAAGSAVIIEGTAEAVATHNAATAAVHGIADTAALVVTTDQRLSDTRTPAAASITDSMIASTLSPSKITGTAAILGANTFTSAQTVAVSGATPLTLQRTDVGAVPHLAFKNSAGTTLGQMREGGSTGTLAVLCRTVQNEAGTHTSVTFVNGEVRAQGETSAANVLLVTSGMAAQTGNHFEARDSAGTVLASISAAGVPSFPAGGTFGGEATNVGICAGAQGAAPSGTGNVGIGSQAQRLLTTGGSNTAIGNVAQWKITTGGGNTSVGGAAHYNVTGNNNTAVGRLAGQAITSGASNVALGNESQYEITTGSYNTHLGHATGKTGQTATVSGTVAIGCDSTGAAPSTTANNEFRFGTALHTYHFPGVAANFAGAISGQLLYSNTVNTGLGSWHVNTNPNSAAHAWFGVGNAVAQTAMLASMCYGTGWTTAGLAIQDAGRLTTGTALSGGLVVDTQAAAPLIFGTNNTERFRWDSAGLATLWDGGNIVVGSSTGTTIATASTQKLGFWGAAAAVQPTAVANATDSTDVIARLNELLAGLRTIGLIAT